MSAQISTPRLARPAEDCYRPESVGQPDAGGGQAMLRGTQMTFCGSRQDRGPAGQLGSHINRRFRLKRRVPGSCKYHHM